MASNNTWARRGAKYGAIASVVGGAVAMIIFTALALLKINVFGRLCVLEGSVLSNVIGAAISIVVLAIGGTIVGAILGIIIMALSGLAGLFRRSETESGIEKYSRRAAPQGDSEIMDDSYPCPCCGYKTLDEPNGGTYVICPVCGWEDDNIQFDDPDYFGGANGISLRAAQREFVANGPPKRYFKKGIDPRERFERDANWRPLAQDSQD
jgi:hypothetical protein